MGILRQLKLVSLCAITFCLIASANAETIRHEFSGVITSAVFGGDDPFDGQIQVGTPFSGFYEFDSEQPPMEGGACHVSLSQCRWEYFIPPYQFKADIGTVTVEVPDDYLFVITDKIPGTGNDHFAVSSQQKLGGVFDASGWIDAVQIGMSDKTGTAISDPRILPRDAPRVCDFLLNSQSQFSLSGPPGGYVEGRIERYTRVPKIQSTNGFQQECDEPDGTMVEMTVDTGNINPASVTWVLDGNTVGNTETLNTFLSLGNHSVAVDVITDYGTTVSDSVTIAIVDTTSPQVNPAFINAQNGQIINSVKRKGSVGILEGVSDVCDASPVVNSVVGLPTQVGDQVGVKSSKKNRSISLTSTPNSDTVILKVIATDASGNTSNGSAYLSVIP